MHNKFEELYKMIIGSENEENMVVLGRVTKSMMGWFIENRPELAEEYIERLCSVKWHNYLTEKEAEEIVAEMTPSVKWTKKQVCSELEARGLPTEEEPYYNCNALYVAIAMTYSDSSRTIAERIMKKDVSEVSDGEMLEACYYLSLDALKDRDKMFNIRKYFEV